MPNNFCKLTLAKEILPKMADIKMIPKIISSFQGPTFYHNGSELSANKVCLARQTKMHLASNETKLISEAFFQLLQFLLF